MDSILDVARLLVPLFLMVCGGVILGRLFVLSEDTLVRVLTDLVTPLMVFHSLYRSSLSGATVLRLGGAALVVVAILSASAFIWTKAVGLDRRAYLPPILFYNTGFLGIPLMRLWGGPEAMNVILVYDQMQGIIIFTLGIFIVTGGFSFKGLAEMVKSPIMWAMAAGFIFNLGKLTVPAFVLETCEFGGSAMSSLAAITLGCSISHQKFRLDVNLFWGLLLRTVVGFFAGVAGALAFGLAGLERTVFIVGSALPSAVFSYVITKRYGADTEFASAMVVASTVLGMVTIPLIFWAARFFA